MVSEGKRHMRLLAIAIVVIFIGVAGSADAADQPPQVTCKGGKTVWIDPDLKTFSAETTPNDSRYEIVGRELFIDPPDRSRYLYKTVTAAGSEDPNRFHSAHYTLIFSRDRRRLTLIHSNEQGVKVTSTLCAASKP